MEKELNAKFEYKYLKNPKRETTAFYMKGRSLHGARTIKETKNKDEAAFSATLSEARAESAYIINGIDENGQANVLVGNAVLKVTEGDRLSFYFCVNKAGNREMKLDFGDSTDKSELYKIDVESTLKDYTLKAVAVSKNSDEYDTYVHIFGALSEKEAEA